MRELVVDVDTRFCADCCATWYADRCNLGRLSDTGGRCGFTAEDKLTIMRRNRHAGKKWVAEYAQRLEKIKGP